MTKSPITSEKYLWNNARCGEREDRVLHATVRETWRQNQHIILAPGIVVNNFLNPGLLTSISTIRGGINKHTSIVWMNFSVSASSSHLHSSSLSGLVATLLRGPIVASAISLLIDSALPSLRDIQPETQKVVSGLCTIYIPTGQSKQVAWNWHLLMEAV